MLALCDAATVVNPSPALTALAALKGWEVVRPQRPWHSKTDHAFQTLALLLGLDRGSR
jgi:hypothetical protein